MMPQEFSQLYSGQFDTFPAWIRPYVPSLVNMTFGLIILLIGWFISKSVHKAVLSALRRAHVEESIARFLSSIAQYCVLAATVISALNRVGVQTTSLVALLASAGLAIGLALQGSLSSFASGVMILFFRPFMLGDLVQLSGLTGTVEDIGLFQTSLAAADGERIILPNSSITNNPIINFSAKGTRRAFVDISVAHGTPIDKVVSHLLDAAKQVETVLETPPPAVSLNTLTASSLDFKVVAWCNAVDFAATQNNLRQTVTTELAAAGISGPGPSTILLQKP